MEILMIHMNKIQSRQNTREIHRDSYSQNMTRHIAYPIYISNYSPIGTRVQAEDPAIVEQDPAGQGKQERDAPLPLPAETQPGRQLQQEAPVVELLYEGHK